MITFTEIMTLNHFSEEEIKIIASKVVEELKNKYIEYLAKLKFLDFLRLDAIMSLDSSTML